MGAVILTTPISLLYNRKTPLVNKKIALRKIFSPFHKKRPFTFRKMPIEIGGFRVIYLNQGKRGTLQWKSKLKLSK